MSLLSGFNVTLAEVSLLGEASLAAFAGGAIPAGWNVIAPQQLGVPPQYWDGNYFTNGGASAIVLQQGNVWIVSFRGTDGSNDILSYPELVLGTYINHFQPLLIAVASNAPVDTNFYFTGASLGGGATNQMANIAGSQYGGKFASAIFVAFASPVISTANGIFNLGFENDPIYKALNGHTNFSSSVDHLVLATPQYMQGNYDGLHPPDYYAHNAALASAALAQLQSSAFFYQMNPDSVVIFDAFSGVVQDITPGRENTSVFYLGENGADTIIGRNGDDHIEGFGGDDARTTQESRQRTLDRLAFARGSHPHDATEMPPSLRSGPADRSGAASNRETGPSSFPCGTARMRAFPEPSKSHETLRV